MRNHILSAFAVLITLSFSSCSNSDEAQKNKVEKKVVEEKPSVNFDWLLGDWVRINNKSENKRTYETWDKYNNDEYLGIGYTVHDSDTVAQEEMSLILKEGQWNFEVMANGEAETTKFKVTNIGTSQFTVENKELSFPNKIKYWKDGKNIKAIVSGDSLKLSFEFEKLNTTE